MAAHLQTGDVAVKLTAHLRARESTGSPQFAGDEASVLAENVKDAVFDGAFLRNGMPASAVIVEIRPPFKADESRLLVEELSIDQSPVGNCRSFPFPQGPVPSSVR